MSGVCHRHYSIHQPLLPRQLTCQHVLSALLADMWHGPGRGRGRGRGRETCSLHAPLPATLADLQRSSGVCRPPSISCTGHRSNAERRRFVSVPMTLRGPLRSHSEGLSVSDARRIDQHVITSPIDPRCRFRTRQLSSLCRLTASSNPAGFQTQPSVFISRT